MNDDVQAELGRFALAILGAATAVLLVGLTP